MKTLATLFAAILTSLAVITVFGYKVVEEYHLITPQVVVREVEVVKPVIAPKEVERFAHAFCENDIEGVTPFIPPQYLGSIQASLAQGEARGERCVSIQYLGGFEKDGVAKHIYILNSGVETNWWVFSFQNGMVENIE